MAAQGPAGAATDIPQLVEGAVAITVGTADMQASQYFLCGRIRRVYCNGAGVLYVQHEYDPGMVPYTMSAGTYHDGKIKAVGGTTTGTTVTTIVVEC